MVEGAHRKSNTRKIWEAATPYVPRGKSCYRVEKGSCFKQCQSINHVALLLIVPVYIPRSVVWSMKKHTALSTGGNLLPCFLRAVERRVSKARR